MKIYQLFSLCCASHFSFGQNEITDTEYQTLEKKIIDWRRDIHQQPELSDRGLKRRTKSPPF